jgi:hypothetical protein
LIDSKKEERANVRRDSRVCEPENAILLLYLYLHTLSLSLSESFITTIPLSYEWRTSA